MFLASNGGESSEYPRSLSHKHLNEKHRYKISMVGKGIGRAPLTPVPSQSKWCTYLFVYANKLQYRYAKTFVHFE